MNIVVACKAPASPAAASASERRTQRCFKSRGRPALEPLRHFIHLLKYEGRPDLAPDLARYLAATLDGPDWQLLWPQIDAISPVPLHAERRRQRGYDQAELLARGLSTRTCLPLRMDLVERTAPDARPSRPQRRTTPGKRAQCICRKGSLHQPPCAVD